MSEIGTEFYPRQASREQRLKDETQSRPIELPVSEQGSLFDPVNYIADDGLADAMNVALLLGQPLLLTGEPGTGKTQFAFSAAFWLGFPRLIRFNVKSTTQARDFFYHIDEIRRFRDAQLMSLEDRRKMAADATAAPEPSGNPTGGASTSDTLDLRHYMTLGPLGEAILRANKPGAYPQLLQPAKHSEPVRSIVLIDEIDKAARDIPNDLLNEFENMEFEVPELNLRVQADQSKRPVLIITSNSERNLPDAFLRRCIYYNIPFPGEDPATGRATASDGQKDALLQIVKARLPHTNRDSRWLKEALELLRMMRETGRGIQKRPGTAELLNWLLVLHRREDVNESTSVKKSPELFEETLPILMKNKSDADIARRIYETYRAP